MIDPEFWSDEKIGNISPESRLLFIGMWNFADDEGIIKSRPEYLRSIIFPYDDIKVSKMETLLQELVSQHLVYPYEIGGQHFILIVNFLKHQVINKPVPSKYPKPTTPLPEDYGSTTTPLPSQEKRREENIKEVKIREENIPALTKNAYPSLNDVTEADMQEIADRYQIPIAFVRSKYEDMCLWVGEKAGRDRGRNWKLTLMNWVKKDGMKIMERSNGDPTKRAVDARSL